MICVYIILLFISSTLPRSRAVTNALQAWKGKTLGEMSCRNGLAFLGIKYDLSLLARAKSEVASSSE